MVQTIISLACSGLCCLIFAAIVIGGAVYFLRRKKPGVDSADASAPAALDDRDEPTAEAAPRGAASEPILKAEPPRPVPAIPPPPPSEDDAATVVQPSLKPGPPPAAPPPPPPGDVKKAKPPALPQPRTSGATIIAFDDEDEP